MHTSEIIFEIPEENCAIGRFAQFPRIIYVKMARNDLKWRSTRVTKCHWWNVNEMIMTRKNQNLKVTFQVYKRMFAASALQYTGWGPPIFQDEGFNQESKKIVIGFQDFVFRGY